MHKSNKNQSKAKANREKERNEGLQSKNNQSRVEDYQALISENGNFFKFWERDEQAGREAKRRILQRKHDQSRSWSLTLCGFLRFSWLLLKLESTGEMGIWRIYINIYIMSKHRIDSQQFLYDIPRDKWVTKSNFMAPSHRDSQPNFSILTISRTIVISTWRFNSMSPLTILKKHINGVRNFMIGL